MVQISQARSAQAVLDEFHQLINGPENPVNNPDFKQYREAALNRSEFSGLLADRGPVAEEFGLPASSFDFTPAHSPARMLHYLDAAGAEGLGFTIGGRLADLGSSLDWWNGYLREVPSLRPIDMTCSTVIASDPEKCGVTITIRSLEAALHDPRLAAEIKGAKHCLSDQPIEAGMK